jgi:ABC-type sugar transport system ATPase subunit
MKPSGPPAPGYLIEARGLVKSFGPTPALRGASVSVAAGEIVAVRADDGSRGLGVALSGVEPGPDPGCGFG